MTSEQQTLGESDEENAAIELRHATDYIVDSEHKSAPETEEGYPLIKTSDIENGRIKFDDVSYVDEETYKEWTRRLTPEPGDIIMTREAPVGRVGIIPEGKQVCLGQRTVLIRAKKETLDAKFLRYFLLSDTVQNRFQALSTGSTVDHLNLSDLRSFRLPDLPSIEDQKKIGEILTQLDEKISINNKISNVLSSIVKTVFNSWFVRFEPYNQFKSTERGEIPINFDLKPITEISEVTYGYSFDSDDFNEQRNGVPVIRNGDIPNTSVDYSTDRYIDVEFDKKYAVNPGDLVVSMDGKFRPYIWKGEDAALNQRVCKFEGHSDEFNKLFLFHSLARPLFELEQTKTGTTVIHLGKRDIQDIQVPVPDPESLEEFNSLTKPIHNQIIELSNQNRKLIRIRDSLLPELMSGEVRVSDISLEDLEVDSEV